MAWVMQDRQGDTGAASDAMGGKHGPGPSAAALDSMLSNEICQEHVRKFDTVDNLRCSSDPR